MSLARVERLRARRRAARRVWVEADVRKGLPAFTIVGLADKAVREARERVRAAIANGGFVFPDGRITINLAPAYAAQGRPGVRPAGGASRSWPRRAARRRGARRAARSSASCRSAATCAPVRGVLAIAEGARGARDRPARGPARAGARGGAGDGARGVGVEDLRETVEVLRGDREPAPVPAAGAPRRPGRRGRDLADVRGHNGLDPGARGGGGGRPQPVPARPARDGKTMLARRLPGLLPPLTPHEAIEVTRMHSIAGLHDGGGLVARRPFRAPHHTISASGLVGGGAQPRPGRSTLAHHGVLFLDELSEFTRPALEALRQPLEDGHVTIVRAQRVMVFPTRVTLVAASNPCPCGMGEAACRCTRRRPRPPPAPAERAAAGPDRHVGARSAPPVGGARCAARRRRPRRELRAAHRRGARPPDRAARRHRPDLQRAAHRPAAARARRGHARGAAAAATSCTTATASPRAGTAASCAWRGRSPTSTAPARCSPTTSSAPRRCGSTTRRSRSRHGAA